MLHLHDQAKGTTIMSDLHLTAVTTTRTLLNQSKPVLTGTQGTIVALVERHMEYQIKAAKEFQAHDGMDEAAARGAQDALEYAIGLLTRNDPADVAMVLLAATD